MPCHAVADDRHAALADLLDQARIEYAALGTVESAIAQDDPLHVPRRGDATLHIGQRVEGGLHLVEPEPKFRRAIDAFFLFIEQQPVAARVLLSTPTDNLVAAELSRAVQVGASARLVVLLATFMRGDASPRVQAATEFLKHGLHALGLWWFDHPDVARAELVDVVMRIAWLGLQTDDARGEPS